MGSPAHIEIFIQLQSKRVQARTMRYMPVVSVGGFWVGGFICELTREAYDIFAIGSTARC
jgi:hypothetical protein